MFLCFCHQFAEKMISSILTFRDASFRVHAGFNFICNRRNTKNSEIWEVGRNRRFGTRKRCQKSVEMGVMRVAVARHGLILRENEATHPRKPPRHPPHPIYHFFGLKNAKKTENPQNHKISENPYIHILPINRPSGLYVGIPGIGGDPGDRSGFHGTPDILKTGRSRHTCIRLLDFKSY